MNTTNTLGELKEKSIFWNRIGGWNSALLILLVIGNIALLYSMGSNVHNVVDKLPYIGILVGFALFSKWTYKRQEQIFSAPVNESLKEALSHTILNFKRYYQLTNLIFLLLAPLGFYAIFELSFSRIGLSSSAIILIVVALTGISFLIRYWYYKTIFFKRIKAMEANLHELENESIA